MRLDLTLVGGPGPAGTQQLPATELCASWSPEAPVSGLSLERALRRDWPGCVFTVAGEQLSAFIPGTPPLCNGAVVVAWPAAAAEPGSAGAGARLPGRPPVPQRCAAVLVVIAGPGAGAVFELHRGSYTIGRGRCRIRIADPTLSRHHCTISVGAHSISLAAAPGAGSVSLYPGRPGTSYGRPASARVRERSLRFRTSRKSTAGAQQKETRLPAEGAVRIDVGQLIGCGQSVLELRFQDDPDPHITSFTSGTSGGGTSGSAGTDTSSAGNTATGTSGFGNSLDPFLLSASVLDPVEVPHQGGSARGRMATAATALVALVFGVVLAVATGSLMFLAFSAMGAVTMAVPMVGGSSRRKALRLAVDRAVEQDMARCARTFPDAGTLLRAALAGAGRLGSPDGAKGIAVRLGTATRSAAVVLAPHDPAFVPPQVPFLPVCVRLGATPVQLRGPGEAVRSTLRFVLMQLDAACVPVIVLGAPAHLPLAARLLPSTTVLASPAAALSLLKHLCSGYVSTTTAPAAVVVLLNLVAWPELRQLAGVAVVEASWSGPQRPATATADLAVLTTSGNQLVGQISGAAFVPDGVPDSVFSTYARFRARSASASGSGPDGPNVDDGPGAGTAPGMDGQALAPNALPYPELSTPAALRESWQRSAGGPLQPVPVGRSAGGALMFGFGRDGPHVLLAGTTGSGKSEFLRTLVGSLAVYHSPADMQFVFIDFKGGAGLASLSRLPHTSSLITDLGGHGMERTLASLRAELHRREAALATVEASDSNEYRATAYKLRAEQRVPPRTGLSVEEDVAEGVEEEVDEVAGPDGSALLDPMTHLVIVIDEFRVLVDQFPDAMNELMRIAAVGRSLGIHLVMATQRPQGALSADIRANVTSSICLRVQSSLDSVDVIGTAQAAAIDVGAPGRAYLSRAGRAPLEFQSATLRLPTNAGQGLPRVERVADLLAADAQDPVCESAPGPEESDVPALAELMDRAWQQSLAAGEGLQQATAVVAEDLPSVLTNADLDSRRLPASGSAPGAAPGQALTLGLVDVPQGQCLAALRWHPGSQSHLACFGTVGETSRAVGLAVGQSQLANSGTAGHPPTLLYLLDGDGSLGPCAPSPWTGACLSPSNLRAVARLVQRLESTLRTDPRMHLLAITDWSRWVSALRSSPWHGVEEELGELIRFSPPNLAVAMGGGRELLSASFLAAIPNRMFFSHGSNTESTMLWPRLPRFQPQPGRAVVSGPINNVSAFLHGPDDAGAGETLHIAQLAQPPVCPTTGNTGIHGGAPASANPPADLLKVRELPSRLGMAEFRALLRADSHAGARAGGQRGELLLGVGGDGLDPVSIVLTPGGVLPVLGGPGTGKSSFIRALRQLQGRTWTPASAGILVIAGAPAGTGSVGGDGSVGILLLDDAHAMTAEALLTATQGLAAGGSIVAVIPYPGSALSRIPLEWGVRTAQQAVVLMPQRPADGDLLGVRLETSGAEPPGRAVLLDRGRSTWFQFPRAEDAP